MRIVAIDLGSAQIKLALFDRRFTKFDILQYEVIEIADYLDPISTYAQQNLISEEQLLSLSKIWKNYSNIANRIVMNIPVNLYTSRVLEFPFKNTKKIAQSARFQIEDEIPFDPEKCIITNKIIAGATDTGATSTLCSVALKEGVNKFTSLLYEETGMEPSILTTVQSSFINILENFFKNSIDENITIMDLGHRNSTIYLYKENLPLIQKTIPIGGYHITKAIAEAYNISFEEAELVKIKKASLPLRESKLQNEDERLSKIVATALDPVIFDFNQCIMAFFSEHQVLLDRVYLCGGTSLTKNIKSYMSDRWNIETRLLNINSHLPEVSTSTPPYTEPILAQVTSLGITQVQKNAKNTPNFHIDRLQPRTASTVDISAYSNFIRTGIIVYLIAVFSLGIQSFILSSQLKTQSNIMNTNMRKVLGKLSSGILYKLKRNPKEIENRTEKKLSELRINADVSTKKNSFFTLELLKNISESIPSEAVTEIHKINIDRKYIKLSFKSPNKKVAKSTLDYIKSMDFVEKVQGLRQKTIGAELSSQVTIKIKEDTAKL